MTIKYSSYTNGDDTTGDGTSGNPYKTINKASIGLTGGDEVREEKSPATITLSGTLSFTDNSTSITTSIDQTSVLAQYDFIKKDSDEDWRVFEVVSVTSTIITLLAVYSGTTETTVGSKISITDAGTIASASTTFQSSAVSGSSISSRLKISGGWTLGTTTQDGFTYFVQTGSGKNGYGFSNSGKSYLEFSHICNLRFYQGWYLPTSYVYGSIHVGSCRGYDINTSGVLYDITLITSVGYVGTSYAIYDTSSGYPKNVGSIYILSSNDYGYYIGYHCQFHCDYFYAKNNADSSLLCSTSTAGVFISEIYLDNPDATYGATIRPVVEFGKATVKNSTSGLYIYFSIKNVCKIGTFIPSGLTNDFAFDSSGDNNNSPCIKIQRYNNTANDSRIYFSNSGTTNTFSTIVKDSTDARGGSGYCLKWTPKRDIVAMLYSIGYSKISSTGSDITLSFYIKDDVAFNGTVEGSIYLCGKKITDWTDITSITTSYTLKSLVASSGDLLQDEFLEVRLRVFGTAGNIFIDDFEVS